MTGQIVWQAADIFCRFLLANGEGGASNGELVLGGKRVVELGSGPGLCGLLAARWASAVVLTDYQDIVMDLIKVNIKECNPRPDACRLFCSKLDWSTVKQEYSAAFLSDENGEGGSLLQDWQPDVLIGTDVVYWRSFIVPLIDTLDAFFANNPKLVFYICYIERHRITHIELLEELAKRGYKVKEIGQEVTKGLSKLSFIY